MKRPILIIFSLILFLQCEDRLSEDGSYFIFGKYNGFCIEMCSQLYKYEDGNLYQDDMNTVLDELELSFKESPVNQVDIGKVEKLLDDLPNELLDSENATFGCPGCLDQDIILVQYYNGDELKAWRLDSFTENMPENIAIYANRILDLLEGL